MSENIENLKSVVKIRILANTTQTTLQVNYFKKNDFKKSLSPLHFEKFRKVRKFDKNTFYIFLYSPNWCKFQQLSRKQYKRTKVPIDLMFHMHLPVTHSFKTIQKCLAKSLLLYSFWHSLFANSLCAVFVVEITPNFNREKSILVCQKFKI